MKMTIATLAFAVILAFASGSEGSQPATATHQAPAKISGGLTAEQRAEIVGFFREYSAAMLELSKQSASDVKKSKYYEGNASMAFYAAYFVENFTGERFPVKSPLPGKPIGQLGTRSNLKPAPPLSEAP